MTDIASVNQGSPGPIDRNQRVNGLSEPRTRRPDASDPRSGAPGRNDRVDRVELSQHARYLDQLRYLPDVRQGRIEGIRDSIASGTYETDSKVDEAVNRLLDDLVD